jgi:two-component system, sensor histidine kinase and response regulator
VLLFDAEGHYEGAMPAYAPEAPPAAYIGLACDALDLPAEVRAAVAMARAGEDRVPLAYTRANGEGVQAFEGRCLRRYEAGAGFAGITVAVHPVQARPAPTALAALVTPDLGHRFRAFYDSLRDGLFLVGVDRDGTFRFVHSNPAHVRMTGVSNEALIGQTPEAILPPETARRVLRQYQRCTAFGCPVEFETTLDVPAGTRIFRTQLIPVPGENGCIDLLVGVSHDVTELRRAEIAEREAYGRLQQVLDTLDTAVWTMNAETHGVDFYNHATLRFLGLTDAPADVEAAWDAAIHPDDRDAAEAAFEAMWQTGELDLDYRLVQPDGRIRWVHDCGSAVRDADGRLVRIIGVASDVTERIAAALELQDARDRLGEILDRVDDAVWSEDAETHEVDFYNDAALRLLGLEDAPGDLKPAWNAAVHPEDREATALAFQKMWHSGVLDVDYRVVRPGGDVRWVHDRGYLVHDEEGRPLRVVGLASDVTARIETAHTLAQARDAAEAATRAKSAFLATMSHEIRTPLNGLVACADLLLDSPLTDEQRDLAGTLGRSATHLNTLINDLLDVSKIEAGRLDLEHAAFALPDVVRDIGRLHEHAARAAGLAFRLEIGPAVPALVLGDAGRLRQVLSNLLSNAVRYTEGGFVALRVERGEAGTVRFLVEDSGVGIEPHVLPKLFEPFTQGDASHSRRYGGTGLGLSIVRRLVEAMGGHAGVESVPGEGSCFFVTIPFEPVPDNVLDLGTSMQPSGAASPRMADLSSSGPPDANAAPRASLRVLVAEDNSVNRAVIERMLDRIGHQATFATNGQEALDALDGARFDVILMDVQMPVLDGVEATRQLRQREAEQGGARNYVVALTANALPGDRERYLASGMDDYLSKPITLASLRDTFARFEASVNPDARA